MSVDSSAETQAIAFFQATFLNNYCQLSITTLIIYEHLITAAGEVRLLRERKFSSSGLIFLFNRYTLFAFGIINAVYVYPWDTPISCEAMSMLYDILQIILYAVAAAFSALRVYAINDRDWLSAMLTLILGLPPVAVNIFYTAIASYDTVSWIVGNPECNGGNDLSQSTENKLIKCSVTIATRTCATASELIVLITVEEKSLEAVVGNADTQRCCLLALNVIQMALELSEGVCCKLPYFGVASEFIAIPSFVHSSQDTPSLHFVDSMGASLTDDSLYMSTTEDLPLQSVGQSATGELEMGVLTPDDRQHASHPNGGD
ncbi:hypothetical protein IEO21_06807 [Rhodonia placenta]|uniref:DUF6533 domain-containing protein n=1 Tax=Rhodonia placenta TaxID=104341 RepID=A0A8H7U0C9_9APHY|nr:hypothetical protein IEO21_06807 [Postia placenta]